MKVKELIKNNGPITVSEFMGRVLPEYYSTKEPFGVEGDFITAPEISQVFGELIGVWVASIWLNMGKPEDVAVVELGGGRGTLMRDFLRGTKNIAKFHESLEIHMVENSPTLQQKQKDVLNGTHKNISWHESIVSLPQKKTFFIANEFFDALPISQYVKTQDGWHERMVGIDGNGDLQFCLSAACKFSDDFEKQHSKAPEGGFLEVSQSSISIITDIAKTVNSYGGAGVFIDYGYDYYGYKDTLQAIKNHKFHNVLSDLGEADITAHVDFTALSESIKGQGIEFCDISTQRDFLLSLGVEMRRDILAKNTIDKKSAEKIISSVDRLIDTKEMGNLFKVLSFFK